MEPEKEEHASGLVGIKKEREVHCVEVSRDRQTETTF